MKVINFLSSNLLEPYSTVEHAANMYNNHWGLICSILIILITPIVITAFWNKGNQFETDYSGNYTKRNTAAFIMVTMILTPFLCF